MTTPQFQSVVPYSVSSPATPSLPPAAALLLGDKAAQAAATDAV